MQARDFMSETVYCCTPETGLQDVARLMVEYDCGAVPVVESAENKRLVGMVTDRDITVRCVADGKNPLEASASACMSSPVVTAHPDTEEGELIRLMEQHQVRRIPIVDDAGTCMGIVSQADIARKASEHETAEVVKDISQPTRQAG
ncbi:MAG: CBS domain-containing protein [Phycisphaeraceae bacterium]